MEIWDDIRWRAGQMVHQFLSRSCLTQAGALTYTTLFAVVPFMTVTYTVLSLRSEFAEVGERVREFVFQHFLPASSAAVTERLLEFSDRAQELTGLGFVFLFITAYLMLVTLEKTLNDIWNVAEPRQGLQRILTYWAVLSLGPPLLVAASIASIYVLSLPFLTDLDTFGIGTMLLPFLPLFMSVAVFTMLYYAVPNTKVRFLHALAGGVITAGLFDVAKAAFAWSVSRMSFEPIYGSFAAVPFFLIWLHLVWVLILGGAVFVYGLSLVRIVDPRAREPLLVKALRVLRLLYDAHQDGRTVSEAEIAEAVPLEREEKLELVAAFEEFRLLTHTGDDCWSLGRSLKALTLWDLYRRLPEGLEESRLEPIKDLPGVIEPLKDIARFGSNEMSVSLDSMFGGLK